MVQSKAATVEEYLEELPEERREVVSAVRDMVLAHLPEGYEETMNWGMISYEIPLSRYPVTYNKQPLGYVALAAQKNYYSLYVLSCYQDSDDEAWLREQFRKAGKKLDMGKCCMRFKRVEDLPLEAIGEVISRTPPETTIERYEESRRK
jgi:hypothetical protein